MPSVSDPSTARPPSLQRRWSFALIAIVSSLAMIEVSLRAATVFSPWVAYHLSSPWTRNTIPDDVLGKRQSRFYPGHDRRGYRNARHRDACEILAVGDSMTYGYAAPPQGSWPAHLERLTGKITYNAGVGSYSPPEYERVVAELLVLQPQLVIVGLNPANDLSDAYRSVYEDGRFGHLKSDDQAIRRALDASVSQHPWPRAVAATREPDGAATALVRTSAVYRLVRSCAHLLTDRAPYRLLHDDSFEGSLRRPGRYAFDRLARARTVFLPPRTEALAIDLDDPRIQEGWRITQVVLRLLASDLESRGVALLVMVIPSKRMVYAELMDRHGCSTAADRKYVELETRATSLSIEFLAREGIVYDYPLPALRLALETSTGLYPETDDQHPASAGYLAMASSMRGTVERMAARLER
jgi:hypothetical protein